MSNPFDIVLVEDAEPDVFLVREALQQNGLDFNLRVFGDGEQASDFFDEVDRDLRVAVPRLLMLDLNLPRKTGAEVLENVRKSSRLQSLPVIVLTSSDSPRIAIWPRVWSHPLFSEAIASGRVHASGCGGARSTRNRFMNPAG